MKKIYSLLGLALASAMTASAADSVLGDYTLNYFNLVSYEEETLDVKLYSDGNQVKLSGLAAWDVPVTVDEEAATLTLPVDVWLGFDDEDLTVRFSLPTVNEGKLNLGTLRTTPSVGKIEGNEITFNPDDIWAIYATSRDKYIYYYAGFSQVLTKKAEGGDDIVDSWTSVGNATFQDGWIAPGYAGNTLNPSSWYEVELQQNDGNENLYRLVNPYKASGCYVTWFNSYAGDGYIMFDVTDPDYVVVIPVSCGFSEGNQIDYYCYNVAGWAMKELGMTRDEAKAAYASEWATTYENGVVTLGQYVVTEDGKKMWDACFGCNDTPLARRCWQGSCDMTTRIMFPATSISDFAAEATEEAPVEYYNLQGVRVEAPAAGQVVISRQAGRVVKTLVR